MGHWLYGPHQALLREVRQSLEPDVMLMEPNCRPWSITFNRCSPEKVAQEREEERPCLKFLEESAWEQDQQHRGFVFEQPWSSYMWKEINLPGQCARTDQCRYGACDENNTPILKPTGLQANFELRYACSLCRGHGGKPHAWLQGQHQGVNRTSLAAMYPERLCKAIVKDIKLFSERQFAVHVTDSEALYYTCPRCSMGRWAPSFEEHNFIPGECRYGKWPEGLKPKTIKQKMLEKEPDFKKTPSQIFRDQAVNNKKIRQAKLSTLPELPLDEEHGQILKHAMVKIL